MAGLPRLLREPGPRFIIPFVDRPIRVDKREQVVGVASRSCATRDEQLVDIDACIAYRTIDPLKMVLAVRDVSESLAARALDILGALVAESTGEDVRFRREALADVTEPTAADAGLSSSNGVRVDWETWGYGPATTWVFLDGERRVVLYCQSEEPSGDRWLSNAETFEFLPAEE